MLFDTGALRMSFIHKVLVDAHRSKWKSATKHSATVVRIADQDTWINTSELVTGTIGYVDDNG